MVQVIKYKCCGKIFAACYEPHCYTDRSWLSKMSDYVKKGDVVEMRESGNVQFGDCECTKENQVNLSEQPNLFSSLE